MGFLEIRPGYWLELFLRSTPGHGRGGLWQSANVGYMALGLDWKTWMREHLVDVIVPTKRHQRDFFELRIEEFVSLADQTGVQVVPSIWHSLGFVDTDPDPTRPARYDKPKTKGMFYAQALMLHRLALRR